MTFRLPHAVVGALCFGFALANLGRLAVFPLVLVAALLGAVGLAVGDARYRSTAAAAALVALAWG